MGGGGAGRLAGEVETPAVPHSRLRTYLIQDGDVDTRVRGREGCENGFPIHETLTFGPGDADPGHWSNHITIISSRHLRSSYSQAQLGDA